VRQAGDSHPRRPQANGGAVRVLIIAIPAGLLIGLSLGALGGGGSILTVPALVYLLHQPAHSATTGSLLIVGITGLAGMAAHARAGHVRLAQGMLFGLIGVAGSYAGTRLSASADPQLLLTAFAALMLVAAAAMALRRRRDAGPAHAAGAGGMASDTASDAARPAADKVGGDIAAGQVDAAGGGHVRSPDGQRSSTVTLARAAEAAPAVPRRVTARTAIKIVAAATAVGLLTGFFGVGGGFVIVPALVLALGFEMPVAVGTSLLVIAINSAAALLARLGGHSHLDWPLLAVFTAAAIAGSLAGHRVASRAHPARLTLAFAILLTGVAAYTASRSIPSLV
jgi:hypothetical protein